MVNKALQYSKGKNVLSGFAVVVIGYLLGSIPSAYIMARWRKGVDIRDYGVGNMGAASVFRHVGAWEGIVVTLADMAKGAVAILIGIMAIASSRNLNVSNPS